MFPTQIRARARNVCVGEDSAAIRVKRSHGSRASGLLDANGQGTRAGGELHQSPGKAGSKVWDCKAPPTSKILSGIKENELVVFGEQNQFKEGELVAPKIVEALENGVSRAWQNFRFAIPISSSSSVFLFAFWAHQRWCRCRWICFPPSIFPWCWSPLSTAACRPHRSRRTSPIRSSAFSRWAAALTTWNRARWRASA